MDAFDQTFLVSGDDVLVSPDNYMVSASELANSSWTAINQSNSSTDTVSPVELTLDSSMAMSAPGSTAFANLSTPGSHYLDSPFYGVNNSSSLDTSPLHQDGQLDAGLDETDYPPLFPNEATVDQFATSAAVASPMSRQKSGGSPGRSGSGRKHSDTAGVRPSKARKPLPDIVIAEEDDKDVAKRKKNTAAARKSRERKLEKAMEAEDRISTLNSVVEGQRDQIQKLQRLVISLGGSPDQADYLP